MITAPSALRAIARAALLVGSETEKNGWASIVGMMPSDANFPDRMVAFRRVGGMVEEAKIQRPGVYVKFPYVQVMVRGRTQEEAEKKCEEISAFFAAVHRTQVIVGTDFGLVHSIKLMTDATFVRQEERNRAQLFSMNFQVTLTEN